MERVAGPDGVLMPRQSGALEQASLEKGQLDTLQKELAGIGKQLTAISDKVCLLGDSTDLVVANECNGLVDQFKSDGLHWDGWGVGGAEEEGAWQELDPEDKLTDMRQDLIQAIEKQVYLLAVTPEVGGAQA